MPHGHSCLVLVVTTSSTARGPGGRGRWRGGSLLRRNVARDPGLGHAHRLSARQGESYVAVRITPRGRPLYTVVRIT